MFQNAQLIILPTLKRITRNMIYLKYLFLKVFLILINLSLFGQIEKTLNKEQIRNILTGEWEREAIGYEKKACGESDRFILSFITDDKNFNSDGHIEYFSYLSKDKNKKICYLEHAIAINSKKVLYSYLSVLFSLVSDF